MEDKRKVVSALIVAILFVSAIAGTIFHYTDLVNDKNSTIASLNNQLTNLSGEISNLTGQVTNRNNEIANLTKETANLNIQISNQNNQISNFADQVANLTTERTSLYDQISSLTAQITNLTSANLTAAITVNEISNNDALYNEFPNMAPNIPYQSLQISGSITNTGYVTALNAGLHIAAFASDGTLEINMTVPLANGVFGTDNETRAMILSYPRVNVNDGGFTVVLGTLGSLQLGSIDVNQTDKVAITIYHEGTVSNWTVTLVWTNSP